MYVPQHLLTLFLKHRLDATFSPTGTGKYITVTLALTLIPTLTRKEREAAAETARQEVGFTLTLTLAKLPHGSSPTRESCSSELWSIIRVFMAIQIRHRVVRRRPLCLRLLPTQC